MVGGHHGQFAGRAGVNQTQTRLQQYEPPLWQPLRQAAEEVLCAAFLHKLPTDLPKPSNISAATMALTGFAILCDWIGSDGRFFVPRPTQSMESYVEESATRARQAVTAAGFLEPSLSNSPATFAGLFPDKHPPRPLQAAIDAIPAEMLDGPCLAIIEAPTGEGKTEAALALAHRLAQSSDCDDLYYALPTTATSNQMFGRLQTHLAERLHLPAGVKLIHGQAFLVEDDLDVAPLDNAAPEDQRRMAEWFTTKKRAILAPFGVGTVDQAELAALNVRHNALRLLGLAGKTVILDEVHAYDTYMTSIVEVLLAWLSALGSSVIVLSATLPFKQRAALVRAYGTELGNYPGDVDSYPSLWVVRRGREPYHLAPPAHQESRRIELQRLGLNDDEPEAKAKWLVEATADGGCACWICNTVDRAQRLFECLMTTASPEVELMLLHARFPLADRLALEQQLTNRFGPGADRPPRSIVVGTQVLEQSLDLDFDLMVSDLAPVDLLLQRAGRLWRHDNHRPPRFATAPLWINSCLKKGGEPNLSVDSYVYDTFLLLKTWELLKARQEVVLPRDYRPLVEAVYSASAPEPGSAMEEAIHELRRKEANADKEARQRLIPLPDPEWSFCARVARLTFEEDETRADWMVAQTRLAGESANVIPLERDGERAWLAAGGEEVLLDKPAPRATQLRLLRHQMRVSRPEIISIVRKQSLPGLFTESARLKGYYPLWLSGGRCFFATAYGRLNVWLDPVLGLVIRTEKGG